MASLPSRGLRPCRIVVLGQEGGAWAATLTDLMARLHPGHRVDVFGPRPPWPASRDAADPPGGNPPTEWRWHAACDDLGQALAQLGCDAHVDVAWVRAGTRLPRGWPQFLQQALGSDTQLGHLAPLHLDDPWLSPLDGDPGDLTPRRVARTMALSDWLADHALPEPIELGALGSDSGILRGQAAVDLAQRPQGSGLSVQQWLASYGWVSAFSRRMVVCRDPLDPRPPGETTHGGSLTADRSLWRHAHPLTGVRHACRDMWPRLNGVDPVDEPVAQPARRPITRLHVAHSWGGGLSKWVRDFVRTDQAQGSGTGLVLRSVGVIGAFGQRLCLYAGDSEVVPLRFWELGVPIHATAPAHLEVRRILREIIEDFGVEQVLVSSLIGHSLDVLRTGLPTVMVAHDHHPFCIALYAHFEGECRQCDGARLQRCVESNPGHRFFQGVSPQDWQVLREAFVSTVVSARLPIVAPSPSVAQRWQSMMPALDPRQFRVIPHGVHLPVVPDYEPPDDGPLRVVVLGRITPEKGSALLMQMLPDLLPWAELVLVGCGEQIDPALRHPRITRVPEFANEDLPAVLAQLRPHLGLMMSTVPETFSYALTELWHAGIPVLATDSGALADRVEPGISGYLVQPHAAEILLELRRLNGERATLTAMRQTLRLRTTRTLQAMLRDYEALLPHGPSAPGSAGRLELETAAGAAQPSSGTAQPNAPAERALRANYQRAIQVNPEVTWIQAARGFWQFTCLKASRSPKLSPWIRRWFANRA